MTTLNQLQTTAEALTQHVVDNAFQTYRELCIYRSAALHKAASKFEAFNMTAEAEALTQLSEHVFVEDTTDEELEAAFATINQVDGSIGRNFDTDTLVPAALWGRLVIEAGEAVLAFADEDESKIARLDGNFIVSTLQQIEDAVFA